MTDFRHRPILKPRCAARQGGQPCDGIPRIPCSKCSVVAYCEPACRNRDWQFHKRECLADLPAERGPPVTESNVNKTSFWGMEPATDIINIEKNEGIGYQGELRLLLTGFSSFRHLIYSIVKLPKEADPLLRVVINECSFPHGMRAFMGLLLLTDRKHDPVLNAEAFIHMWYSSRVSRAIWEHITDVVGPNIEAVVQGIERRNRMEGYSDNEQLYHYRLLDPLIPRGGFVMLAIFTQAQWWEIRKRLKEPGTLPADKATIIRFLDVRKHSNSSAVYKARMTSARLMTLKKWQYDGCLLPYGHPRDEFDTVNPLFLHEHDTFPPGATQEPMGEWPMEFLDNADSPATGDVYGKLFYYLRDLLVQCQLRLKTLVVDVDLMTSLPKPFVG